MPSIFLPTIKGVLYFKSKLITCYPKTSYVYQCHWLPTKEAWFCLELFLDFPSSFWAVLPCSRLFWLVMTILKNVLTCKLIIKELHIRFCYKRGQTFLQNGAALKYYKIGQLLLQSGTAFFY